MAVRVRCEWLAVSLVLAVGACSGKSGQGDGDAMVTGGATSHLPPGKMQPAQPTQPVGGSAMMGSAGEAPAIGGRSGAGGSFTAGAGADVGAAGAADVAPGIMVSAPGDHKLHESYGTVHMQVKLTAQPQAPVKVDLVSSDPLHAVVYPLSLTFTPEDWEKPQTAVVAGVRDSIADGGNAVTIETRPAVSTDPRYTNLDGPDLEVFVIDETEAGIVVGSIAGGVTSESGGTATFNIVLTSQPTSAVTIPLSSSDPGEASVANSVVFEPSDWSEPQQVTVTGVDDALSDGVQVYEIVTGAAVSNDMHYAGIDPANVQLSNADNE
jgi:large repetitive protein